MKKYIPFLVVLISLMCSCSVQEIPSEGGTVAAKMENDNTRSAVTDEGRFTWSEGDRIWIQTTSGHVAGTLSSGAGSSDAQFTYGSFIGEMTGKAVYPYNPGHSISESTLNVVMPSSYDLGEALNNTNAIMFGMNVDGTLEFSHMAGVMRFSFKNVPAGTDRFTITLDKKINGTFTADLEASFPVIQTSEASDVSERTITLNFNPLAATEDVRLYVPLPIGIYNSLELGLYCDDQPVWTYSNTVTNAIARKSLKIMPTVTLAGEIGGGVGDQPSGAEMQTLVNRMNTNLSALKDIAGALKSNDHITDINPLLENSKVVGYTVDFHDGLPITLYYEKDSDMAVYAKIPDIGIMKDVDGEYYWSVGDEWMLDDDGARIIAGDLRGSTGYMPQVKTIDGKWYYSYNRGETWTIYEGQDNDEVLSARPFADLTKNGDYYIFFLSNGTLLRIPLCDPAYIRHNHWNGKIWYAYGTSLTSASVGKYVGYVEQLSGLNAYNKGIPGGAIVVNTKIKDAVMNTTDGKLNADLITLEVGANDAKAELGDPSDNTSDTFCGALTQCINYLLQNTNARIVVMSSTTGKSTSSGGSTEHGYAERNRCIQEVCRKCCVHYIGLGDESGLGWGRLNNNMDISYNADYIHHSDLGGYNLAQYIWSELKDIPLWFTSIPEEGDTPQTSYWAGKKFVINGDSVVYGSGLSSVYDGFSYLVADHFGMDITNYAIGGSVIARKAKDYDECYTSKAEWEADMNAGLLNTKKKYLVNTESGAPRVYRIYSYNGSKWVAGANTSDASGRVPLSDRIRAMDTDADVVMIMAGSNDFYYNWTPFGDFEYGKNRENLENVDPDANILESEGVELVHKAAPPASTPVLDYSYPAYFTYCKIPVVGGCEVKVPYGRRGWWLDKDGKGISNKNFTSEVTDFTATAPYNAAYLTVCFKYEEVNPEDCVVYMSVPTDKNAPNETFCDGLHKLCRYLCDTYKGKDIIFLTPIKRKQPKGTGSGTWDCLYPEDANAEGKTLIDYRDAIIEACEYYSIPYIDMYTLSGLDPHTDPSLFADTDGRAVHPNEEGHRIFADVVIEQMLKLKR